MLAKWFLIETELLCSIKQSVNIKIDDVELHKANIIKYVCDRIDVSLFLKEKMRVSNDFFLFLKEEKYILTASCKITIPK